jgi:hypothetical protein
MAECKTYLSKTFLEVLRHFVLIRPCAPDSHNIVQEIAESRTLANRLSENLTYKYQEMHKTFKDKMSIFQSKSPSNTGLESVETLRVPVSKLTHEFAPLPAIYEQAVSLLRQVREDSEDWFKQEYGIGFDKYNVEHGSIMKPHMFSDLRFVRAREMLELPSGCEITLPWWNELTASESRNQRTADGGVHVELRACHSFQRQAMRQGQDIPGIHSVSVAGFVHTSDDQIVISLRGGATQPNTYYFSAGALGMTPALQSGQMSIYQFYLKEELSREYGMRDDDIGVSELLCRVALHGRDRDVSYVFEVQTPLTFDEMCSRYEYNRDQDKKEHQGHVPLRRDEVVDFVREFYKGVASNDQHRPYSARVLLAQGAAPLLVGVGGDLSLLDELAAQYEQPV